MLSTRIRSSLARLAVAVPLLFTFVYVSHCSNGGDGFVLDVKVGHLHVTATSCR